MFPPPKKKKKINQIPADIFSPALLQLITMITMYYDLEVVHQFTNLGSTIMDSLSLNAEINRQIGGAPTPCETDDESAGQQAHHPHQDGST